MQNLLKISISNKELQIKINIQIDEFRAIAGPSKIA